jgi:sialate O-acetylesterase
MKDVKGKWVQAAPSTVRNFSAVGYWFGSKLQKALGVPVGLINNSYGGTTIEAWLSRETLAGVSNRDRYMDFDAMKAEHEAQVAKAKPLQDAYDRAVAEAKAAGRASPPVPPGLAGVFRGPSMVYNGEVAPLIPYAVRGVAWYQGESNAYVGRANSYEMLLRALLRQWRGEWRTPGLPFILFQIAPNRKPQIDPNEHSGIAVIQEAQLRTFLDTPHTALVTTMDLGEADVHYKRKEPAGERAMNAALAIAYGKQVEYLGPILEQQELRGSEIVLTFSHARGGLVAKDGPLSGFAIAGADGKFVFADARIEGARVFVSSSVVPNPVAVRYGWADYPHVNLFNQAGLPASPFRTDHFELPSTP